MIKYNKSTSDEALFKFDFEIKVRDKQKWLSEILSEHHYETWFNDKSGNGKIFILNKGRCGNGGTTGFINYAREHFRGLIVSVPNRSIVISKEDEHKDACCVYGGAEDIEKNKNIRICTWDKTGEVEKYAQFGFENIEIDDFANTPRFWAGSLLVVDEYHKLIDDSNYREVCYKIVKSILTTDSNVVLLSATPDYRFIEFLRLFSGKDVITYNVKYDDEYTHKQPCTLQWFERKEGYRTYDIVSDQCEKSRARKKQYELYPSQIGLASNKLALFFNSVQDICRIVNQMPDTSDVEVLCSKTELHEATVPCYSKAYNPEKQIHFMTKAYLTGMDIPDRFWRVEFIGGNDVHYLAYSNKEVKQGLGRFRGGYATTAFVSDGKVKGMKMYAHMKAKITALVEKIQKRQKYADDAEYVQDHIDEIVQENIDYLYYTTTIESMDGWEDFESFEKMMSVYPEYKVLKSPMPKPKQFPRARDISFKVYKEKRLKGIKVAYKHSAMCEKFIDKYGLDAFKKAGRNEIERKVKLDDIIGEVDVESMTPEHKYDLLLGDGFYKGSYLMSVLDYLGEKCDYEMLEVKIREVFGAFCVYQKGDISKLRSCWFLCALPKPYGKSPETGTHSYYKDVSPILGENRNEFIRVSKKVSKRDQRTQAITDYLDSTLLYSMINDGDDNQKKFFTKLLDNPSLIPEIKQDLTYKKLFDYYKMNQTMISEFYKEVPSSVRYPHKKDEMEKVDCLIVDIDDTISYNEFKETYGYYEYTAYPTISNPDRDNWTKFRVILPLAQTLSIPNDSLNVLKLLRRMVCQHEDKCHQLGSNINAEQWAMRRHNEGMMVDISQDTITYLDALLKNLNTYDGKFKKTKDGGFTTTCYWTLDYAIAYYQSRDKKGERHPATFAIKNRLSLEDCEVFENWLRTNHPACWMEHWKSHKRIAS